MTRQRHSQHDRIYRLATRGQYGGVSVAYISNLLGADRRKVQRHLDAFYARAENRDKKYEPQALGVFITEFTNDGAFRALSKSIDKQLRAD
jgi:hypothetical protein